MRRFWQTHPRYPDLVDNIQGKYSFKERPSFGIVVRTGSANRVDLSADNYIGLINSYVYHAKVQNFPGVAVEWVREDSVAIQNNNGKFPTSPGVYFIELTEDEEFYIDPLYEVSGEQVTMPTSTQGVLAFPPLAGTLRLFEMPAGYMLYEGTNYNLVLGPGGTPTGEIELVQPITNGRWLVADYRYPGDSVGPYKLEPGRANNTAIPGCVIAFGRRNQKGDRLAIVVQDIRRPAYLEYGGKWELSVDLEVLARDVFAQQEIADNTAIYLWGILRPYLSTEGLEMTDLTMGGETEEPYDDNGDDYFFGSTLSLTIQTDWSVHVPLNIFLRAAGPLTVAQAKEMAGMSDDEVAQQKNNLQLLESLGLNTMVDPFFAGKTSTFETVR